MGAFFTNVQVRADAGAEVATRQAVIDALTARVREEGFAPSDEGLEADRTIVVGPPEPWIAFYDEATESQRVESLDDLARLLSGVTGGPAVGVLVHDSDHLLLRLFEAGQPVDRFERGGTKSGATEAWAKLCKTSVADLRAAFDRRDLFVEQTLRDIAVALGMTPDRAGTGCRYLLSEGPIPEGSLVLRLRLVERPAHEASVVGPPRLVAAAFRPHAELSVGGPMHLGVSVRNEGGASRGLMLAVHGEAIEGGLVEPERAQLVVGMPKGNDFVERPLERRTLKNGRPGYVVEVPDLAIPAGSAGGLDALAQQDPRKWVERMHASQVHANVLGTARAAGSGRCLISFVPLEAREAQFHHAIALSVVAEPRKPLRGAATDPAAYVALETPDVLVALAVSTLDRSEASPIAAELVVRWSELWPADAQLSGAMFGPFDDRPTKPGSAKLKVKGLATSAAWKKLRAAFPTDRRVSARRQLDSSAPLRGESMMRGDGFEFGGTLAGPRSAEDPELPTLQLGVDLRGREDVGEILDRARKLVDDFVARAKCAQAFLARWKGDGSGHTSVDSTPYERACQIHGGCTLRRSWATRFLRGVSLDGVWLGQELLARVDRAALDAVGVAEAVGDAVRIIPREGVTLDALEAALAPVLASAADGRAGVEWVYGRAAQPPG